jgi:hypothetical protein
MNAKTKTRTLLAIGLIFTLWAGFLIGISVGNSKPDSSRLTGTFGKAEKFRKVQMTPKDIKLRSELVKDTAKLKSLIQGLVYFSVFTEKVSTEVEYTLISFESKGMGKLPREAEQMNALRDFSDFIRNNNKTLNNTISMLSSFYRNDSAGNSHDVEKNLRDFTAYVDNLNKKNPVLNQALITLDDFILKNKVLLAGPNEIEKLKAIRDQLLVKGIQLGAILRNQKQVSDLIVYTFASQEQYKSGAIGQLNRSDVWPHPGLCTVLDRAITDKIIGAQEVTATSGPIGSGAVEVLYDKSSLQFIALSANGPLIGDQTVVAGMQDLCMIGTGQINVTVDTYNVMDIIEAQVYNAMTGYWLNGFAWDAVGQYTRSDVGFVDTVEAILIRL